MTLHCLPCCLNKCLNLRMSFSPRVRLHAARHVHGKWPDQSNSFGYIIWRQTARQNDWASQFVRRFGQLPVKLCSSAAEFFRHKAIEQPGRSVILRQFLQSLRVPNSKSLDRFQTELAAKLGRLIPMKLQCIQPTVLDGFRNEPGRSVHKHPNLCTKGGRHRMNSPALSNETLRGLESWNIKPSASAPAATAARASPEFVMPQILIFRPVIT